MSNPKNKNPDNPFAALDASRFPRPGEQGRGRADSAKSENSPPNARRSSPVSAKEEEDAPGSDAFLFLHAMGSATPLRGGGDKKKTPSPKAGLTDPPCGKNSDETPDEFMALAQELERRKKESLKPDKSLSRFADLPGAQSSSLPPHDGGGVTDPARSGPAQDTSEAVPRGMAGALEPDDDASAFFRAMKGTSPLSGKGRKVSPDPEPAPAAVPPAGNPLQDLVEGRVEFALHKTDEYVEGHVVGLDLALVGKLQARQYSPESHIDLHGMNSEQAFRALVGFFRDAYYKGARIALVVTGRGKNSLCGVPVLRRKVQEWLVQEPFRRVVLAFCTAKREDGGPGALYVMLRKRRKNSGKIRWNATPADPDLFP